MRSMPHGLRRLPLHFRMRESAFYVTLAAIPFGLKRRAAGTMAARAGCFGCFGCLVHCRFKIDRRLRLGEKFRVTSLAIVVCPLGMGGMIESHVAHF